MPNSAQQNAYNGSLASGKGVIRDQLGNIAVVGAQMAAGAAGGNLLTSDTSGNLTLQQLPSLASEPAGTLAVRYPSSTIATSALATFTTGGQVAVGTIGLPQGMTVSNISVLFGSTGVNGPTHLWFALLDSTLHVLAVSADQTNGTQPANTLKTLAVTIDGTNPYVVPATGVYYIAASSSASTTAPTAAGITPAGSVTGITPVVCGTAGTQAAPPSAGTQLNSGTVTFSTSMNFAAWIS